MRAAHVIKGASSNLMCQELRETATNLEQSAAGGNEIPSDDGASDELEKATEDVKEKYSELKKAVDNYHEFLESVDI
jgi:HPt (histidine-containing phosphotransfer) domain-containing protein